MCVGMYFTRLFSIGSCHICMHIPLLEYIFIYHDVFFFFFFFITSLPIK